MNHRLVSLGLLAVTSCAMHAQVLDNLVIEGVPPITPELKRGVGRYVEFRAATFADWHPTRREALVSTRFADAPQLHLVKMPGGERRQLTFLPEPVARSSRRRLGEGRSSGRLPVQLLQTAGHFLRVGAAVEGTCLRLLCKNRNGSPLQKSR